MNPNDLIILGVLLGLALSFVIPSGVERGAKYERPTERDFEELLRRTGQDRLPRK